MNQTLEGTGSPKVPEQKSATKPVVKSATKASLVYIGPSVPPGIAPLLQQYRVYADGKLDPHLDEFFKACPAIRELIVPTSDLGRARRAMATPGTREHAFSVAVQEYIGKLISPAPEG